MVCLYMYCISNTQQKASLSIKQTKFFFKIQKITFISYLLKTIDVFCQFIAECPSKYFSFSIPLFLYCECLYQVLDYSIFHGYPVKKYIYIKTIEIFPLTLFERTSVVGDFDFVIIAICNKNKGRNLAVYQ